MSSYAIQKPQTVDFTKFQFGDPTVNKYGGKSCRVKYDNQDFYIQLPRMRLHYGLGVYEEKDTNGNVVKSKYSMDFSLSGYELGEDGEPIYREDGKVLKGPNYQPPNLTDLV